MGDLSNSWAPRRRLTWSVMDRWLSCRRRWYYRHIGKFVPPPGMALMEGSLMHALFEDEAKLNIIVQADGWGASDIEAYSRQSDIEGYVNQRLLELVPLFDKHREKALEPLMNYDPRDLLASAPRYTAEDVEDSVVLICRVFANWLRLRGADDLLQYRILASEAVFDDLIIPKPTGGRTRGWRLGGILDALIEDRNNGQIILRELKTTGGDATSYERRVDLDPQVRLYAQAAELAGLTDGRPIEAVQYIVLRKKVPSLPKMLKCKKCKETGELHKTIKHKADPNDPESEPYETTETSTCPSCDGRGWNPSADKRLDSERSVVLDYLENLGLATTGRTHDPDFMSLFTLGDEPQWHIHKRYHDLVSKLKGWDKFISMKTYWLDPEDKAEALWEAWMVSQEIADATRRYGRRRESHITAFPRNTAKCTGPAGFCEYKQVCLARMCAEDFTGEQGWETNKPDSPEILELKTKKEKD